MRLFKYIKIVRPYFKDNYSILIGSALFGVVLAGLKALQAYIVKPIFDQGLSSQSSADGVYYTSSILFLLIIVNFPARYFHFYWIRLATTEAMCKIREKMYQKLSKLPLSATGETKEGTIVSKIMLDTIVFAEGFKSIIDLIREPLTAVFMLGIALYRDWQLTMVMIVAAPFFSWVMNVSGRKIKNRQEKIQERIGEVTHVVSEGVGSQKITKAFNLDDYVSSRFVKKQNNFFKWQMKSTRVEEITHPTTEFITGLAFIGIIIFAHYRIKVNVMTAGDFVSFITAIALLIDPIKKYAAANMRFSQSIAAGDRIFSFLQQKNEIDEGEYELSELSQKIEIKNLSFSYEANNPILENLNLEIQKGKKVALVGLSGSGKSTLINLLLGLYPVPKNSIFVDGKSIEEISLSSLRSIFSLVTQDVFLFNDSIEENLKLGRKVSDKKLKEALEVSHSDEFIEQLPDGINTVIGDRGLKLSGGQRQRLTIARAALFDFDVLLLDEATSALDNKSEKLVQKALESLGKDKTVIAVAHRLSTIQDYDEILVFDEGKIVERGTHEKLIDLKGQYFSLYELSKKS